MYPYQADRMNRRPTKRLRPEEPPHNMSSPPPPYRGPPPPYRHSGSSYRPSPLPSYIQASPRWDRPSPGWRQPLSSGQKSSLPPSAKPRRPYVRPVSSYTPGIRSINQQYRPSSPASVQTPVPMTRSNSIPAANRASFEVLDMIFTELKHLTMEDPLPKLPVEWRDSADVNWTNERFTPGEVTAYKSAMFKKQLFDLGKLCRPWFNASREIMKRDIIIIGDRDVERIIHNPSSWLPLKPPLPLRITISCTLPSLYSFLCQLSITYGETIPLKRLTLLHSFAPEKNLSETEMEELDKYFKKLEPEEVCIEWYSGQRIVAVSNLNRIATLLRKPWGLIATSDVIKEPYSVTQAKSKAASRQSRRTADAPEKTKDLTAPEQIAAFAAHRNQTNETDETKKDPEAWNAVNALAAKITRSLLTIWKEHMVKFELRANWLDIHRPIRLNAIHGALKDFDYHYIPLAGGLARSFNKVLATAKGDDLPMPTLGCLKALDNIIMWDFRYKPQKWKKKLERKKAAEDGLPFVESPLIPALRWRLHVPWDQWMQQKNRLKFKGLGQRHAFRCDKDEMIGAIGRFLIEESKLWRKPTGMDYEWWTEKMTFEKAMEFALERRKADPKERPKMKGHLLSITGGKQIDGKWIAAHLEQCKRQTEYDRLEMIHKEENALCDPDPDGRQAEFNAMYVKVWLYDKGEIGRKALLDKLRRKYGTHHLWTSINWQIYHPDYEGLSISVEKTVR